MAGRVAGQAPPGLRLPGTYASVPPSLVGRVTQLTHPVLSTAINYAKSAAAALAPAAQPGTNPPQPAPRPGGVPVRARA